MHDLVPHRSCPSYHQFYPVGAWTFRTMISHQQPLTIMYDILSLTNSTILTADDSLMYKKTCRAHNSVVGLGIMLQAERSQIHFLMSLNFFNVPNASSCTMALGLTQPLTEMSTRSLPRGKWRLTRKADNLTTICEPTV
jgi:hypothetical protein